MPVIHCKTILAGAAAAVAALSACPASAQDLDIGQVVVTPNRAPTAQSKVGSAVDTVSSAEIEQRSQPFLTDYLATVPGVSVASPGGPGQEDSLEIRGADKKYVKTLYNGIDISDPTSTQVQTPYQNLLIGGVDHVEVLKGSQSTLYGSDAIAGVIGIDTLGGIRQGMHQEVSGEFGSFGTYRGGYTLSGAGDGGKASLGIYGLSTNGISAALANGLPPVDLDPNHLERDGFHDLNFTFAGEKQLTDNFSIFGSALVIDAGGAFDDSGYPPTDNDFNFFDTRQDAARAGFNLNLLGGRLRNTVSAQASEIDRHLYLLSGFGPYDAYYHGVRTKLDYQGAFDAARWLTLQYGADYERQQAHATDSYGGDTDAHDSLFGVWSQAVVKPVENLTLTAGLRHDEHSQFGGDTTYRLTGSYSLPGWGARFHTSLGTGFRAPSLFELYDPYSGNAGLKPEKSVSFDAGVEQKFLGGRLTGDVTYFLLNTDDLIDYDFSTSHYEQFAGTTRRDGVEASLDWSAAAWLDLGAAYTYTHTRQPDGERRPRVPEHDVALSATVRPAEKWMVNATAHIVLDTVDQVSPSYGTVIEAPLSDYVLLDAKVAYNPTENTELYLRGENLLDQKYQVVYGYGAPGIGVFGGFKVKF